MAVRALLSILLALVAPAAAWSADGTPASLPYQAYWLVLADQPRGCEACYVPLLLTRGPIEALSLAPREKGAGSPPQPDEILRLPALALTTYERDSIYNVDCASVTLAGGLAVVNSQERIVVASGRRYRYDPAPIAEVIRLLRNPMGIIAVHRPAFPSCRERELAQRLLPVLEAQSAGR